MNDSRTLRKQIRDTSALVGGSVTFCLLLTFYWLTGIFLPSGEVDFWMSSLQATGGSLTYSTTPAFLLAAHLYVNRSNLAAIDRLIATGCIPPESRARVETSLGPIGLKRNVALTILGLIAGAFNVPWDYVIDALGGPVAVMAISYATGNIVTWTAVVHSLARRIIASIALLRVGREDTTVDLFRLDALLPFGRVGTQGLFMVVIAVSLSGFQSLDAQLRWINYSSAFTAGIPAGLALLLIPMIGIHRKVRAVKRAELARLDEAITAADRALESDPLHYFSDLLQRRETVAHAREWPLDTTALSRVAIYFVIPPIAWVGGALVEIIIQAGIGAE